jgi:hypothetical protein
MLLKKLKACPNSQRESSLQKNQVKQTPFLNWLFLLFQLLSFEQPQIESHFQIEILSRRNQFRQRHPDIVIANDLRQEVEMKPRYFKHQISSNRVAKKKRFHFDGTQTKNKKNTTNNSQLTLKKVLMVFQPQTIHNPNSRDDDPNHTLHNHLEKKKNKNEKKDLTLNATEQLPTLNPKQMTQWLLLHLMNPFSNDASCANCSTNQTESAAKVRPKTPSLFASFTIIPEFGLFTIAITMSGKATAWNALSKCSSSLV